LAVHGGTGKNGPMALFERSSRSGTVTAGNGNGAGTLPRARWLLLGAVAGATAGSVLAGATSGLASYFARQVLTPVREHVQDLEILAVVGTWPEQEIILPATLDTTAPGVYSVYF